MYQEVAADLLQLIEDEVRQARRKNQESFRRNGIDGKNRIYLVDLNFIKAVKNHKSIFGNASLGQDTFWSHLKRKQLFIDVKNMYL